MTESKIKQTSSLKQKSLLDFYESKISKILVSKIKINERIRSKPDKSQIERLSESIKQIGLMNPITITREKILVAGYHRLQAFKLLGYKEIPCVITTTDNSLLLQLQEIDENLIRYDLHFIDRGQHLKRRKEIYEELYPETKQGGDRRSKDFKMRQAQLDSKMQKSSFIEDTAKKIDLAERTISEDIQIAENIDFEIQDFIKEKDISKKNALKIARMPREDQIKVKEEIEKGNTKDNFIDNAYARVKKKKRPKIIPKIPEDKFNVIYADPPWFYEGGTTPNRIIENQYPTMKTMDICKMKVPSAKNAILFLWVTSPKLEEGLEVVKAWGFIYKTNMVWVKNAIGMGYYARGQHELLLIATKGSPGTPEPKDRPSSVIEAPRTKHSKKPEIVYELIEKMYPEGKYLELFARNKRENWTSWGDEVENK